MCLASTRHHGRHAVNSLLICRHAFKGVLHALLQHEWVSGSAAQYTLCNAEGSTGANRQNPDDHPHPPPPPSLVHPKKIPFFEVNSACILHHTINVDEEEPGIHVVLNLDHTCAGPPPLITLKHPLPLDGPWSPHVSWQGQSVLPRLIMMCVCMCAGRWRAPGLESATWISM